MVNVSNSYVATPPIDGGVLYSADLGTALPDTALEALNAAFLANDHGAIGDNGIGINRSRTTQDIKAFGGKTFRTVQTESDESVTITFLEDDNLAVLETVFGEANVEVETATSQGQHKTIYHALDPLPIKSWVINSIDGEKTKRYVIQKGQVTETAEVTDVHTDVTRHQVTIKTYESSIGNRGENVVELRHDAAITGN